jgi:hypothetical protein
MTDERSFQEMLEYRLAILKIESAFEACSQFGNANKQAFYGEIKNGYLNTMQMHLPPSRHLDSAIAVLNYQTWPRLTKFGVFSSALSTFVMQIRI